VACKRGRRSKLTPTLQQYLVRALSVGCTHRAACQYAGIHYATFYRWLHTGETGKAPYDDFCNAIKRAEAEGVLRALEQIHAAGDTDWRAAAWLLERRYPEEFSKRRVVEQQHTGTVQHGHAWIERLRQAHADLDAQRNEQRMLSAEPPEAP
jgi:hypothetical protein